MTSFDAHWLNYLSHRSKLRTRVIHYLSLALAQAIGIALAVWFQSWGFLLICLLAYGIARASRELREGDQVNPYMTKAIFNVVCFFRMLMFELTGNLPREITRMRQRVNHKDDV
jgi:hypothetical protein